MDCVSMLIPGSPAAGPMELSISETAAGDPAAGDPAAGEADTSGSDDTGSPAGEALPRLDELVGSVSAFLKNAMSDQMEGAARYMARVAANSLDIAVRQLLMGPALESAEHARLRVLLPAKDGLQAGRRALVDALRSGSMPLDHPGLAEHLRLTVAGQLAIDQPDYHPAPGDEPSA